MSPRLLILASAPVCCLAVNAPAPAAIAHQASIAPDPAAIEELLRSARLWQSLGYPQVEARVLRKLLAVQGDEPRALLLLGELNLEAGNVAEAHRLLERLRRTHPDSRAALALAALEHVYTAQRAQLAELRLAVRGGQRARALALAHRLFPDGRPPGGLANEFAPLLASTPEGWQILRAYLQERIAADNASSDRLTLYELLAQHEDTRAEALRGFADLVRAHDVQPARIASAWRRALDDLADDDAGLAQRRRFLEQFPRDTVVRDRIARIEDARSAREHSDGLADDPGVLARRAGERALDAGALSEAETQLQRSLALRPDDGESIGTLGLLRLRQGRNEEALQLFTRAAQAERGEPGPRARWVDLMATARYWAALQRARALGDAGQLAAAVELVESVRATQPGQVEADHLLASLRAAQGQTAEAEALLRGILQRDPRDRRAWRALLDLRLQQGRIAEALDTAQALPLEAGLAPDEVLDAGALRDAIDRSAAARTAHAGGAAAPVGRSDAELRWLERGVDALPREPWLRYDLAQEYRRRGRGADARALMHEGVRRAPQDAQMRYAAALVDSATGDDDAALAGVDAIPAAERSTGMLELAQRLRFEDALRRARTARDAGKPQDDAHWRAQALREAGDDPARQLRVAQADLWADDPAAARAVLGPLQAAQDRLPPDTRRELAAALFDAGRTQDAQASLGALLAQVPRDPEVLLEAARESERGRRYEEALAFLREVGSPPASSIGQTTNNGAGAGNDVAGTGNERASGNERANTDNAGAQDASARARERIEQIEARRQPRIETAWLGSTRSADAGISTLRGSEVPVVVTWPFGYGGHGFAQVDTVHLDAGTLPRDASDADQFGKVLALAPNGLAQPSAQSAQGLSLAAGWRADERRFDLGVVGIGFKVPNLVGGWRESGTWRDTDVSAEVSRRVLTGSLLSYAGAADPVTGTAWGGVTNTGMTLRAARDLPLAWSLSSSLSLGLLSGRNVPANWDVQSRTVIDRDWVRRPDFRLSAGGLLSLWHYRSNESFYTFGQGGYYSPQRYVSLGLPVEIEGRHGALAYDLRATPSHSWTYEQSTPYYPGDDGLQRLAGNPIHSAGPGGGLAGSLRAAFEVRAGAHWAFGAWIDIDRSAYYAPTQAMIYLRYWFEPQRSPVDFPPSRVVPVSQF